MARICGNGYWNFAYSRSEKTFSPGSFYRESELFTLNNSIFKDVTLVLIWKDLNKFIPFCHLSVQKEITKTLKCGKNISDI